MISVNQTYWIEGNYHKCYTGTNNNSSLHMYVYQYQYKQHYKYHAIKCYEHFYVYCRWLQMSVESEQGTCIWNVIINRYLY